MSKTHRKIHFKRIESLLKIIRFALKHICFSISSLFWMLICDVLYSAFLSDSSFKEKRDLLRKVHKCNLEDFNKKQAEEPDFYKINI